MKNTKPYPPRDLEALQARFALRVAAHLTEAVEGAAPDVSERLRFAREQALQRARTARHGAETQVAPSVQVAGGRAAALLLGGGGSPCWLKLASLVPLVMLIAGLSVIEEIHDRSQIAAAADIDVALLSDKLPPDAYRDPGFVEFLKTAEE
jgi:hypothetical protein